MASVNKVILIGNCGRDPEMRYLPNGTAATSISVATTSKRKDKNSGEVIEDTQWHRVQFFDRLAEIVGEYVKKGSPLYIEGRLKYGKFTNKDGVEQNTCDIVASEMQLLGGKSEQSASRPAEPRAQAPRPTRASAPRATGGFEDMDDDIPFMDPMKSKAFALSI